MSEMKTFEDLYFFLKVDMGRFILFGHDFKNSINPTWSDIYNQYLCDKCDLVVESYNQDIIMFENAVGIPVNKKLLLKNNLPTCEKRCNDKLIKSIIK